MTMSKENARYWFSVYTEGSGRMFRVISAHSIERVRAFYERHTDEYIIEQLTWADLNHLIGIVPPTVESESTFAEGHLLFEYDGAIVSIEVID